MPTPQQSELIDRTVNRIADIIDANDITRQRMLQTARDQSYPDDLFERADDLRSDQ